jgi:acyl-CoA synthetase (NDP forming)
MTTPSPSGTSSIISIHFQAEKRGRHRRSTAPGKLGHDILANLKNGGFAGPLYPINPKAEEILGLKVYKSIADTPEPPELAVVVIPAKIVTPTLEQCAEKGVKARW